LPELLKEYKNRTISGTRGYPLASRHTGPPHGIHKPVLPLHDQPDLVLDMVEHLSTLWIAIWEEVLAEIDVDVVHIWEDVSSGKGSMISPRTFRQFMLPAINV